MPRKLEVESVQAELAGIEALLVGRTEADDPIGYLQLNERKKVLERELKELQSDLRPHASIAIIFGGSPVFGAKGIHADFAGKSLDGFQSIVATRFAELEGGDLGRRGPVAMERDSRLLVTQTLRGSFGFVLEEYDSQSSLTETQLKAVVSDVATVLGRIAAPDEEIFEEAVSILDARTLATLRNFFGVLDDGEATMKLVDDAQVLEFDRPSVHRARLRADMTEVVDVESDYIVGTLQGLLPDHRKFEFRQSADSSLIYGSITAEFARQIQGQAGDLIGKQWRARFKIREVRRRNLQPKYKYTLIELAEVSA